MPKNAERIREDMVRDIERLKKEQRFKQMEQISFADEEDNDFDFQGGYYLYRQRYEATVASTAWKLTQPFRKLMDFFNRQDTSITEEQNNFKYKKERTADTIQRKRGIAVICFELPERFLLEVLRRLNYIEEPIDLYVSEPVKKVSYNQKISLKYANSIEKEIFMAYELVLYLNVNESTFIQDLDGILRDAKMVKQVLSILREEIPRGGMISGDPAVGENWKTLFEREEEVGKEGSLLYPWNGCFWLKTNAVKEIAYDITKIIRSRKWLSILPELIRENGYAYYLYNPDENRFSEGKSQGFVKGYLATQTQWRKEKHDLYVIDIFDTLFTNVFYDNNGFYQFLQRLFEKQYHLNWNFARIRLEAEMQARKVKQQISINDIYLCMEKLTGCADEVLAEMQEQEICQWIRTAIPRREVLKFCQESQEKKIPVYFINNSFLGNSDVAHILEQYNLDMNKIRKKDEVGFQEKGSSVYLTSRYYMPEFPKRGKTIILLSPQVQFYLSEQYDKFKGYLEGSLEENLMLGILVNKHLYNSPVALNTEGTAECCEFAAVAEGIVGPIFLAFMEYIEDTTYDSELLLFLAREGWFLQRLYKQYCNVFQKSERKNSYFYTSRRAASIPQISSYEDIKELLRSPYSGKLSTLMRERFGLELKGEDIWINSLKQEFVSVLDALLEQFDEFGDKIEQEKQLYLKYAEQEIGQNEHVTVIDVGYSGSIQYYLMRLLKKRLDGCYLATEKNVKPEKVNGVTRGMYHFWLNPIFSKMTLFIEAVTCAPHGQVIHFEERNGQILPVLKEKENKEFVKAELFQEKMLEYVNFMGDLLSEIPHKFSHNLVLDLFTELQRKGLLNSELKQMFAVNDEYCNDGEWYFDEKRNEWKLRQRS